jgi:creatinine amidohydrolase/Fe(II)-dependent formamide hydrolase-like protein
MDQAGGYELHADIGFSSNGQDAIEAWVTRDLSPNGAIGNPLTSSPDKGEKMFEAKVSRLAQLLEAIYSEAKREVKPVQA